MIRNAKNDSLAGQLHLGRSSTLFALASCVALLLFVSSVQASTGDTSGAFEPSAFVQGVAALFGFATLSTGLAALIFNRGLSLLIDTGEFVRPGPGTNAGEAVRAPNVRGWGARQVSTGVTLWAALWMGHEVLFQVGLASVVIRQALDVVVNLLDGSYKQIPPFFVLSVPAVAALVSVLS